ncbi:MAG: NUDIX hydrolase [Candidatus Puniceispirillum sp.]|nr:NUDIX hydrolase [Candidatus Pelagibacter sp.]MBA4283670.1 NUDIX hydrolase [Candidatus Puniceispirillum sp.]
MICNKTSIIKNSIYNLAGDIPPFDNLEKDHIQDSLKWIASGDPLFRVQKPDVPRKHLVSYFLPLDQDQKKVLLVDHKNAQLWLPPGGHVEIDEHPKDTAIRECKEELDVDAVFWSDDPFFLTSTAVENHGKYHTDVSFWYILTANSIEDTYNFDQSEFSSIQWFHLDEIPWEKSDPHMHRFIEKLKQRL